MKLNSKLVKVLGLAALVSGSLVGCWWSSEDNNEETKTEESKTEESKTEESKTEESKTDEDNE